MSKSQIVNKTMKKPQVRFKSVSNKTKDILFSTSTEKSFSNDLGSINQVPHYQIIPFVYYGYRINHNNFWKCIISILKLHNETFNIWTHLIGFFLFLVYAYNFAISRYYNLLQTFAISAINNYNSTPSFISIFRDKSFLVIFSLIIVSAWCMLFSTIYHIFSCCEHHTYKLCLQFDTIGITLLISWSIFAGTYIGFLCIPKFQKIYLIQSILLALLLLTFSLLQLFNISFLTESFSLISFIGALSGVFPFIHYFYLYEISSFDNFGNSFIFLIVFYIIGMIFYSTSIPEKWFPGKFDIYGHSHQIWHIFVFLASFSWVQGCCRAYMFHLQNNKCNL